MRKPPAFLYGTAWKEERTAACVRAALEAGFRGIDTANQRKHYFEAGVGEALAGSGIPRDELFLQTKFTYVDGQDERLPYDPRAPLAKQVEQSFASSLEHLRVERIDSYVLHGPSTSGPLGPEDWETWSAMEALHEAGRTRHLGISNVNLPQLEELHAKATVKPAFVQNRCYASRGWDRRVRDFCRAHRITYQGFSLLTANPAVLQNPRTREIAKRHAKTPAQVVFRFALDAGMLSLTGTTSPAHLREDLAVLDFALSPDEVRTLDHIAER